MVFIFSESYVLSAEFSNVSRCLRHLIWRSLHLVHVHRGLIPHPYNAQTPNDYFHISVFGVTDKTNLFDCFFLSLT